MSCSYARNDGAYVLGALAPAERAEFERHLPDCRSCRNAVAELAVLPGLLGRLDATIAEQIGAREQAADGSRVPRLLRAAQAHRRRERTRNRWRVAGAGFAAACLALVIGVGVDLARSPDGERIPVAMASMWPATPDTPGPVTAEVALVDVSGGTAVWMHCAYQGDADYHEPWTFRLFTYDREGRSEEVGSWVAGPGDDLTMDGLTRFSRQEVARVELRRGDGTSLLVYTP